MDHEEFLLVLEFIHMVILNGGPCHLRMTLCITKREKAESEAQRGKPKGTLESEIRSEERCDVLVHVLFFSDHVLARPQFHSQNHR